MAEGKKLNELRVCDLKDELEKRKLETIGPKASLLERLQKALKDEGHDPNNFVFNQKKSTPKKPFPSPIKSTSTTLIKEEPLEEENSEEYGENGDYREHEEGDHYIDEVGTVDDECVIIDDEEDYEGEEEQAVEEEDEAEAEEENTTDGNNQDNEESINLTIGEEEQKLLHDEAPDDKDKSIPDVPVKSVEKDAGNKATGKENKSEQKSNHAATGKNEKKAGKDDDAASKHKSKNEDNATNDKKDDSDKPASKTTHKDDKEKSTIAATAADATKSAASSAKSTAPSRNLWVSGLSSLTRASDLKTIFSKHGKVIGAKVVTNTRTPGTRCYGYVTMSSSNDAGRCIEHLHRTELHGRIISVERTKNEIGGNSAGSGQGKHSSTGTKKRDDDKRASGKDAKTSTAGGAGDDKKKTDEKRKDSKRDDAKKEEKAKKDDKDESKDSAKDKDDKDRSDTSSKRTGRRSPHRGAGNRDHDREREQRQKERERERERLRQREILSYQKIREERERQRLREKERELREEDRRRREIRERQRQEEQRLADERKKLALERERLEREKAELLRLERERQKLEREKIELERLELKRQQMKIIHSRDDPVKRTTKRAGDDRYAEVPERKRSTANENRFEAPPPPRFDSALVAPRSYDKKREDYSSTSTTKRVIDEYATSKRTDYASKRDDYSGTTVNKRGAALDEYAPAPPKRNTDDYSKRSTSEYISSASVKRGGLDYVSSKRDDYKREVEIRHIPASSSSGGVNSSYHSNSLHKSSSSRYGDAEMAVRSSASNFRRIDDRSAGSVKRYDNSSGYAGSSAWTSSTNSHMGHASVGAPSIKSYVSNGMSANMHSGGGGNAVWQKSGVVEESNWRGISSSQDRYDRTYNERSGNYIDTTRASGVYGGSGRSAADRYGGTVSSRYDNGKY